MSQLSLFSDIDLISKNDIRSTTFADNMKLPIHRWFKYSAGFSADWVKKVICEYGNPDSFVLDPFAGSGTTDVVANELGISSLGYEEHYFIRKIANIKLLYNVDLSVYLSIIDDVLNLKFENIAVDKEADLLIRCYDVTTLKSLIAFRDFYLRKAKSTPEWDLFWLTLTSILRSTSHAGTAQWQYILPNNTKKNPKTPCAALKEKAFEIVQDLKYSKNNDYKEKGAIIEHDAREENPKIANKIDLVITSPPYPNNYDYADSTRLEMLFWKEINGWSDLYEKIRKNLIRSCSQHSAADKIPLDEILEHKELLPIKDEITMVCKKLEKERLLHGGKKTYHTMIASYYYDMARVFLSLRKAMKNNSTMCFVIGDSAPYGVYAPADVWLAKLAVAAGFSSCSFEKTRDRNIKWKNRKHTVPLKEGRLWIRG